MSLELTEVFNSAALAPIMEEAGAFARALIDQRTRRGEFLGGPLANRGYSQTPMPFSELTRQITAGQDEVFWATRNGESVKYLRGGYKRFRELTGRRTDKVELTFSGAMLNSLYSEVNQSGGQFDITITVPPSQQEKAFHTNNQREWMGLNDSEIERVGRLIERRVNSLLGL